MQSVREILPCKMLAVGATVLIFLVLVLYHTSDVKSLMPVNQRSSTEETKTQKTTPEFLKSTPVPPAEGLQKRTVGLNLTIVTAFFDIGKFGKGNPNNVRSMETYLEWTKTFRFLQNPLVAYTDSERFMHEMKSLRADLSNVTKIFLIDRNSSWAFRRKDVIKDIFAIKGYPKHHPNTVVPEYSCSMHAKYDVISRAAKENYFHTDYFAWLDIGLFRNEVSNPRKFILQLPGGFNSSKISVNRVYNVSMNMEIPRIIKEKMDWICGCIFVGERKLILKYAEQYKRGVHYLLSKQLMNTDQQVLYAMYSEQGRKELNTSVGLQLFESHNSGYDPWFYLGYIMRKYTE